MTTPFRVVIRRQVDGGRAAHLGHTAGMPVRLFVDAPLSAGARVVLPPHAARHVQVLRLQPGDAVTLFDGHGGQWRAEVLDIGRKAVAAQVLAFEDRETELALPVTLVPAMPANERMDTLVEKATELGAAAIAPMVSARSVLRVAGDRAERKAQHWQAIARSACEQCGRNRVPPVATPQALVQWLAQPLPAGHAGLLLSLEREAPPLLQWLQNWAAGAPGQAPVRAPAPPAAGLQGLVVLSGPEGGFTPQEIDAARNAGYQPVSLGALVLRADTAPLAALAVLSAWWHAKPGAPQLGRDPSQPERAAPGADQP